MRIGLAGPVQTAGLRRWLDLARWDEPVIPLGGGGTPVTLLARALLGAGHDVVVTSLDLGVAGEVVLSGPHLRICFGPLRPRHRGRDRYRVERRYLIEAIRCQAPDLVHAHWSYEYALAALASDVPTLITVHDWAPRVLRFMPDPYRFMRLVMNGEALSRARHLTAPSPYLADRLRRWTRRSVPVIPNALEDVAFDQAPRRPEQGSRVLLAVNDGFGPRKNVGVLLEAFRGLRAGQPDWRLVLAGHDFEPEGAAQRWAAARGLTERVEFLGPLPYARVQDLMDRADVLVHPSREESFGMVVLEAMARRLPVVAGATSGAVPWLLDGGRAGVLTDVSSAPALAGAVAGLLADGDRWRKYSEAGFERAWTHFRMSKVVDEYIKAYKDMLADAYLPSTAKGPP